MDVNTMTLSLPLHITSFSIAFLISYHLACIHRAKSFGIISFRFYFYISSLMQLIVFGTFIFALICPTPAVTMERRVHHHKHHAKKHEAPVQSLSELLARSSELTKAFEKNASALRERVQEVEESDSSTDSSFLEKANKVEPGVGLKAMEEVTEEIMKFTDKMRKMGNEVSLFSSR